MTTPGASESIRLGEHECLALCPTCKGAKVLTRTEISFPEGTPIQVPAGNCTECGGSGLAKFHRPQLVRA